HDGLGAFGAGECGGDRIRVPIIDNVHGELLEQAFVFLALVEQFEGLEDFLRIGAVEVHQGEDPSVIHAHVAGDAEGGQVGQGGVDQCPVGTGANDGGVLQQVKGSGESHVVAKGRQADVGDVLV